MKIQCANLIKIIYTFCFVSKIKTYNFFSKKCKLDQLKNCTSFHYSLSLLNYEASLIRSISCPVKLETCPDLMPESPD